MPLWGWWVYCVVYFGWVLSCWFSDETKLWIKQIKFFREDIDISTPSEWTAFLNIVSGGWSYFLTVEGRMLL